jgi:GntR family transcriptional regulator
VGRVRDLLRAEVLAGKFGGAPLISEAKLGVLFSVSRGVIREALDLLREEGLIVRLQGAGTFAVATNRSAQGLDRLRKITDELERGSARVTWNVVDLAEMPAPPFLAAKLDMAPGAPVIALERLMILDGRPLSVRTSWFPHDVGAPLLNAAADLHLQIYDLIENVLGQQIWEVALQLEPTTADSVTAPMLDVDIGAPLQLVERLISDPSGRAIEYGHGRSRGDRFVSRTVLRMPAACRQPRGDSALGEAEWEAYASTLDLAGARVPTPGTDAPTNPR